MRDEAPSVSFSGSGTRRDAASAAKIDARFLQRRDNGGGREGSILGQQRMQLEAHTGKRGPLLFRDNYQ